MSDGQAAPDAATFVQALADRINSENTWDLIRACAECDKDPFTLEDIAEALRIDDTAVARKRKFRLGRTENAIGRHLLIGVWSDSEAKVSYTMDPEVRAQLKKLFASWSAGE